MNVSVMNKEKIPTCFYQTFSKNMTWCTVNPKRHDTLEHYSLRALLVRERVKHERVSKYLHNKADVWKQGLFAGSTG